MRDVSRTPGIMLSLVDSLVSDFLVGHSRAFRLATVMSKDCWSCRGEKNPAPWLPKCRAIKRHRGKQGFRLWALGFKPGMVVVVVVVVVVSSGDQR